MENDVRPGKECLAADKGNELSWTFLGCCSILHGDVTCILNGGIQAIRPCEIPYLISKSLESSVRAYALIRLLDLVARNDPGPGHDNPLALILIADLTGHGVGLSYLP